MSGGSLRIASDETLSTLLRVFSVAPFRLMTCRTNRATSRVAYLFDQALNGVPEVLTFTAGNSHSASVACQGDGTTARIEWSHHGGRRQRAPRYTRDLKNPTSPIAPSSTSRQSTVATPHGPSILHTNGVQADPSQTDQAVQDGLRRAFAAQERKLQSALDEARERFTHAGDKGDVTEDAAREFLASHLPRWLQVGQGEIIDRLGGRSRQHDVLLLSMDQPLASRFRASGDVGVLIMEKGALSWKDRSC